MPPHRTPRSRPADAAPVDIDSDGAGDTENDDEPTPKPQRSSRKRLSEAAFDPSFTTDSSRAPLKSVNINDDAAEKRRRRKSARPPVPLDDNEAGPSTEDTRAAAHARQTQQLLSVAEAPAIDVPLDVMNSNFEEWMKMATDNVRSYTVSSSGCQTACPLPPSSSLQQECGSRKHSLLLRKRRLNRRATSAAGRGLTYRWRLAL